VFHLWLKIQTPYIELFKEKVGAIRPWPPQTHAGSRFWG
jgi:hypothetical protein